MVESLSPYTPQDFDVCKKILVQRGNIFLDKVSSSRKKIAHFAQKFIRDGSVSFRYVQLNMYDETGEVLSKAHKLHCFPG